jgi:SpoVK/Ycf46/Vps4 family AAA+-type ATPase
VLDDWGFRRLLARGEGLCVMFAGESGTGKTLAAEVLARRLELNLYSVDLSAIVSKYIGETEKNLRRLFDAAEDGGVILFFDEADALFGRRTEVKDSLDRYANTEINYLLQRIEAFRGMAILATNAKSQIDTAFLRRLRFVVDFPFPGTAERTAIWKQWFPNPDVDLITLWKQWFPKYEDCGTPVPFDPWAWLGQLNFNGGSIKTVALNAAYLAAADQYAPGITLAHALAAARQEFVKQGRETPRGVNGPPGSVPSAIVLVPESR